MVRLGNFLREEKGGKKSTHTVRAAPPSCVYTHVSTDRPTDRQVPIILLVDKSWPCDKRNRVQHLVGFCERDGNRHHSLNCVTHPPLCSRCCCCCCCCCCPPRTVPPPPTTTITTTTTTHGLMLRPFSAGVCRLSRTSGRVLMTSCASARTSAAR